MSGPLVLHAHPVTAMEAATKGYTDESVASARSYAESISAGTSASVVTLTQSQAINSQNDVVLIDCTGGARTVTLPAASSGKIFRIKKIDSTLNAAILQAPQGSAIDGRSTRALSFQYDSLTVISTSSGYFIV